MTYRSRILFSLVAILGGTAAAVVTWVLGAAFDEVLSLWTLVVLLSVVAIALRISAD